MNNLKFHFVFLLGIILFSSQAQTEGTVKIALLKYNGGGDWYANPTALPNLVKFCNHQLHTNIQENIETVEVADPTIFDYPLVHLTGHGNVVFSMSETENLRMYLSSGGFLHISDNYGIDPYIRREMKKVFPELEWIELPFDHPIYHSAYNFDNGLPKIHEHDQKAPQGFGLILNGKLICFYDYECDLGDGWEDQDVHNDPEDIRLKALKMGANIISFVFTGK